MGAPVDQVFPFVFDEVSVVLVPLQIAKIPAGVITGVGGIGLTVTITGELVAEQPFPLV